MFSDLLNESGLSLDRLRSFCLVAQAGGVTRAARSDPAKQSLFSRQIKELEEFFGAELIRRKGRGIVLTAAGERLYSLARECFASLLDFKNQCKALPVEVVVGAGESIIEWLLLPHLNQIRNQLPNLRLTFLNLPTDEAIKRLMDGALDFAVVRKDAISRPLRATSLGVLHYSLFVPQGLRAVAGHEDTVRLLDGLPLATLEGEGSFRNALAQTAKKAGISLNIQVECSSFPLAARAVARGGVAAILPSIAAADLQNAAVSQLSVPALKRFDRELCLAMNVRLLRVRPALQAVADALAQRCRC